MAQPGESRSDESFNYLIAWRACGAGDEVLASAPQCPSYLSGRGSEAEVQSHVQACVDMFARGRSQVLTVTISRVPITMPHPRRHCRAGGARSSPKSDAESRLSPKTDDVRQA